MQNPRLASRYAKSLIGLAVERNCLEETLSDMQLLDSICSQSQEFAVMLRSPVIPGQKKLSVINAVVSDKMKDLTKAFISLLVTKGRELNLPEIAEAFIAQYKELKNIRVVNVTTAVAMDSNMKGSILNKISGYMPSATIELNTKVNEQLIGGFVLEVEGQLFDASVKKKLNDIKTNIVDMSYVSKM
jgi:F-type H+-transporting ATPase subunit delta